MGLLSILSMLISRNKNLGYYFARIWSKALIFIAGIQVKVKGIENIPKTDHAVYIANHQSLFDIPLLYANIPNPFIIMAKKSLFMIPIFGWHLSLAGNIAIDRENTLEAAKSLLIALKKAKKKNSMLLFPEGTRSPDGNLLPFKKGAFLLAKNAGTSIIPLIIKGTNLILPKGKIYLRKGNAEIEFLPPLKINEINQFTVEELSSHVWNIINNKLHLLSQ